MSSEYLYQPAWLWKNLSQELSTINVVEIIKNLRTQSTKVSSVQKDGKRCRKIQLQKNEKYQARNMKSSGDKEHLSKEKEKKNRKRKSEKKEKRKTVHNKNMNQEIHLHQQGPMIQMKVIKKN